MSHFTTIKTRIKDIAVRAACAELNSVAATLGHGLHAWSATTGLVDTATGSVRDCPDPLEALEAAAELPDDTVVLFRDMHLFLGDANPVLARKIKDAILAARASGKTLAILGCRIQLPPELEREFAAIEFALPGAEELSRVLDGIAGSAGLKGIEGIEGREALLDAARGINPGIGVPVFSGASFQVWGGRSDGRCPPTRLLYAPCVAPLDKRWRGIDNPTLLGELALKSAGALTGSEAGRGNRAA